MAGGSAGDSAGSKIDVLILAFERRLGTMIDEVLALEGHAVRTAYTSEEALALVEDGDEQVVVLIDNLQVHREGQAFLAELRRRPDVRRRLKVVSMAAVANAEWLGRDYADVIDAHLMLPFTVPQLLRAVETS